LLVKVSLRDTSWVLDGLAVTVVLAEGAFAISSDERDGLLLGLVLFSDAIALAFCRRSPLAVLAWTIAAAAVLNRGPILLLPVLYALFTLPQLRERRTAVVAAVISGAALLAATPLHGQSESSPGTVSRLVALALALAFGLYVRARADYVEGLGERAIAEERVRIARELHDVVAHNVSLMVVQAQALAVGTADSEQRTGLTRVAELGRDAMSEMHRMLGLLRIDGAGPAAELSPQPGVKDLEALLASTRRSGIRVDLAIEGEPRQMPAGVDLSAYRIVQEALTNVIRHAHASRVDVALTYLPEELRVSVTDDGVGTADGAEGHGLVGMRERVALFGGTLETGASSHSHGYRVFATLPTH
jgi:signal transduction histidine kinase